MAGEIPLETDPRIPHTWLLVVEMTGEQKDELIEYFRARGVRGEVFFSPCSNWREAADIVRREVLGDDGDRQ